MENFQHLLESYVAELDRAHKEQIKKDFPILHDVYKGEYNKFSVNNGKRFVKVINTTGGQRMVHCFVEIATGDIYKAATWSAPAKHKRGNIQDLTGKPIFLSDYYL